MNVAIISRIVSQQERGQSSKLSTVLLSWTYGDVYYSVAIPQMSALFTVYSACNHSKADTLDHRCVSIFQGFRYTSGVFPVGVVMCICCRLLRCRTMLRKVSMMNWASGYWIYRRQTSFWIIEWILCSHSGSVGTGPRTCPRGENYALRTINIVDGRFSGVRGSTLRLIAFFWYQSHRLQTWSGTAMKKLCWSISNLTYVCL